MTTAELKKLNRAELLTMLMSLTQRCDDLEEELEEAKKKIEDRSIEVSEAGTLAEAVLKINGVMEAVDRAGMQYLENLKRLGEEGKITVSPSMTTRASKEYNTETRTIAEQTIEDAKAKARVIEEETKRRCVKMVEDAKNESQAYWDEVYSRIEEYYKAAESLKSIVKSMDN